MRVAVLSPHRDDAAFSCGLTLDMLVLAEASVTIVNVCTISRYAPYLNNNCLNRVLQVTEARRSEDLNFVDLLVHRDGTRDGRVELLDLAWRDVPLRWDVADDQALAPVALPTPEIEALTEAFRAFATYDVVLAPFALGGHVDHRLVRQAAQLAIHPSSLVFYEDLPYACRTTETKASREQHGAELYPTWLGHTAPSGLKRKYALCYPSQIASQVADEMEHYGREHGGRECFIAAPAAMLKLEAAGQPQETAA